MTRTPSGADRTDATAADVPAWAALILIAVAYAVGVLVRCEHLGAQLADARAHLGDVPLPTSLDAYFYGAGIQHALSGMHAGDPYVPTVLGSGQVALGAGVAALFGLSVDQVMAWLPVFLGPLVVAPVVVLGRLLGSTAMGFAAALAAGLGFSYFGRTSLGYFDTDWAAVTGALAAATAMSAFLVRARPRAAYAAVAFVGLTPWFHPPSGWVMLAEVIAFAAYVLVWRRRETRDWVMVLALGAALLPLSPLLRPLCGCAVLVAAPWLGRHARVVAAAGAALAITFVASGGLAGPVAAVERMLPDEDDERALVDFVDVDASVGELQVVSVSDTAERLAGSVPMLLAGLVGLALLARRAVLLPLWPLGALGLVLGFTTGARFTVFAVPVIGLGVAWLAFALARQIARHGRLGSASATALGLALSAPLVIAALVAGIADRHPPAVGAGAIETMRELGKRVAPGDFAITWWDYGYAVRYAAGTRTLVDGGRHGADTFIVAEALAGTSQMRAANLTRLAVETSVRMRNPKRPVIHRLVRSFLAKHLGPPPALLTAAGESSFSTPPPTREVYLVLLKPMVPLVALMNEVRRARGLERDVAPVELVAYGRRVAGTSDVALSDGWAFDAQRDEVTRGDEHIPVERHDRVTTLPDGTRRVASEPGRGQGVRMIWLEDSGEVLALGQDLAASVLVQLLVYDRYDPALFEEVLRTPAGAVFRVLR